MKLELIFSLIGLTVAALAAILGMWMERDDRKPPRYAYALSLLILMATGVGMYQSYMDAKSSEQMEKDLARMIATLDKIAANSEVQIPELNAFIKTELEAQSRANPEVIEKVAQRVADEGGDPTEVLGTYLPPSELENIQREGMEIQPKSVEGAAPTPKSGDSEARSNDRRKNMKFGGGIELLPPGEEQKDATPKASDSRAIEARGGDKKEEEGDEDEAPAANPRDSRGDKAEDKPAAPGKPKPAAAPPPSGGGR